MNNLKECINGLYDVKIVVSSNGKRINQQLSNQIKTNLTNALYNDLNETLVDDCKVARVEKGIMLGIENSTYENDVLVEIQVIVKNLEENLEVLIEEYQQKQQAKKEKELKKAKQ